MSNDWRRKISRLLAGGVLLTGASLAVAAPWVVVTAERTSYKSGALLDDKTPIKLGEGAQLTLLAEDGKTLKLAGPYAGVPGNSGDKGAQTNNLTAIASLLQGHRQSTSTLGVMRSFGSDAASPDPIEVDKSGEHCLISDPVVLLRDNIAKTEEIALVDEQGATLATFTWPARQAELPVPARYFQDGKRYRLQRGDKPVSLLVHKAATTPINPAALAAWMVKQGCEAQAMGVLSKL